MGAAPALTRLRHELIRAELARSGGVRIRDLVDTLGVSRATVRRDLHTLVDAGEAINARGGALLPAGRVHGVTALEHESTARAAADTIAADQIKHLGLFGGPLIHDLARRLVERSGLHVVTNSLAAASILTAPRLHSGPQVTLLSGTLSPAGALVGNLATDALAAPAQLHTVIDADTRRGGPRAPARSPRSSMRSFAAQFSVEPLTEGFPEPRKKIPG